MAAGLSARCVLGRPPRLLRSCNWAHLLLRGAQLIAVTVPSRVPASEQPATKPAPSAVVPVLMQGMMELNRKRPADPIEFLCAFLQQHNPKKQQKTN